jgi:hypothetical protein
VNAAGRPTQVGGTIARVLGWLILAGSLFVGLLFLAFFQWAFPGGFVGYLLGGFFAILGAIVSTVLLKGGGKLQAVGAKKERDAKEVALYALAARHDGIVTAEVAADALAMSIDEADQRLTDLVKEGSDVRLEVDDDGRLLYLFGAALPLRRVRIEPGAGGSRRVADPIHEDLDEELFEPDRRRSQR